VAARHARQFGGVAVGAQLRVAREVDGAGHAGQQCGFVGRQCGAVQHAGADAHLGQQRLVALLPFQGPGAAEH